MREIEVKARVENVDLIIKAAKRAGIDFGPANKQVDTIFCWPGAKDYELGSVWLRIRTENDNKVLFTLKKDNGNRMDSTEHELVISDAGAMQEIVHAMGYQLYATMTKTRRKARIGNIELCLDEVEHLGTFLEAEIITDDAADHTAVVKQLWSVLHKVGVERTSEVLDGYDVLLRNKHKDVV